jgi:hypothetical protein
MREFHSKDYRPKDPELINQPDMFFRIFIEGLQPGRILLPADGERSNAVFAAGLGWKVDAFDFCLSARRKALDLAMRGNANIEHFKGNIEFHELEEDMYDVIALIHVDSETHNRSYIHKKLINSLRSGGYFLIEVFSKNRAGHGGNGNEDNKVDGDNEETFDIADVIADFSCLDIETLYKEEVTGNARDSQGHDSIIRMVALKP